MSSVTSCAKGLYTITNVPVILHYRVYEKKLNKFEIALNFA